MHNVFQCLKHLQRRCAFQAVPALSLVATAAVWPEILSAGSAHSMATATATATLYTHTKQDFVDVYNGLREELLSDPLLSEMPESAKAWLKEMLDYNVPGGKLNRGMAVYDALAACKNAKDLSETEVLRANVLGWCIEWLQAFFLVADDIMDGSITRRGQPCWYKQPHVGMVACNDYILLECCIFRLLKLHFANQPAYQSLCDLFHEVTYQTALGQLLDLTTAPPSQTKCDLTKYTLDTYMRIVTYKTAYYSFYLPVACGLILADITAPKAHQLAKEICIEMGCYFQIQDDYLDCYADPEVLGKIGTDIEDNKCSWLICTALKGASEQQRGVFEECYGRKDAESVAKVKAVYRELQLEEKFRTYEAASYSKLISTIEEQTLLPKEVFTLLLNKIYKRKK